ncbi:MAG: T9SS type A sorting domain-containing protein [Ignavibacteriales bacterium]|nr:T9SS type A sorting domain-containing protein [Ignavibacteriales bacterium]
MIFSRTLPALSVLLLLFTGVLSARTDSVKLQWPNPPFTGSHDINGTFCEFRNTLTANHFHNGVDIGEPDGYPIYSSLDGVVHVVDGTAGSNSYVRVRSLVEERWKHISYVHIQPNPGLAAGSPVVAGVTILGTVLDGLGHVHLTERELVPGQNESGAEINALRNGGGLTPYLDPYTPVINKTTLRFRQAGGGVQIPPGALFGKVEIIIKVDERNGLGTVGGTKTNNGTYAIGYRIRSADTSDIVSEPPDQGLRYRFDRKPLDSYVGRAFLESMSTVSAHYYIVTNGSGAAAVNSSRVVATNSFDTELLPEGNYVLEIFTEDTRANRDSAYFAIAITRRDLSPPAMPVLRAVVVDSSGGLTISWYPNSDADLAGYRLSYLVDGGWKMAAAEDTLTKETTSISYLHPRSFLAAGDILNLVSFRLTVVDTAQPPNESLPSHVYSGAAEWFVVRDCFDQGNQSGTCPKGPAALIVDGFDRYGGSGSWSQPSHDFVSTLSSDLPTYSMVVSGCANEAVIEGSIDLRNYSSVFWILGDESTADRTFTPTEQARVEDFLENGGRLFISGSEIGWDLGRTHAATQPGDLPFYNNYLKAAFVYDGNTTINGATGIGGTAFDGITVNFGQTYPEDYPDDIDPRGGSFPILAYNALRGDGTPRKAGVAFSGTFGNGTVPGKLLYLAFPFETIGSASQRRSLMDRVLQFFDVVTSVDVPPETGIPLSWHLGQNFPNPFNPSTSFELKIAGVDHVSLKVFNLLGQEVATLVDGELTPGIHRVSWEASVHPSGVYFCRMSAGGYVEMRKLVLLK